MCRRSSSISHDSSAESSESLWASSATETSLPAAGGLSLTSSEAAGAACSSGVCVSGERLPVSSPPGRACPHSAQAMQSPPGAIVHRTFFRQLPHHIVRTAKETKRQACRLPPCNLLSRSRSRETTDQILASSGCASTARTARCARTRALYRSAARVADCSVSARFAGGSLAGSTLADRETRAIARGVPMCNWPWTCGVRKSAPAPTSPAKPATSRPDPAGGLIARRRTRWSSEAPGTARPGRGWRAPRPRA